MEICQKIWDWWRLPTIFELGNICWDDISCSNARSAISLELTLYWSSTEGSNINARLLSASTGYAFDVYKNDPFTPVVCIHD
jgi:hypothetical protein